MAVDLAQAEMHRQSSPMGRWGFPAAFFVSERRKKGQFYSLRESEDMRFTNPAAGGGFPRRLSNL
jgi:hypothetical protein